MGGTHTGTIRLRPFTSVERIEDIIIKGKPDAYNEEYKRYFSYDPEEPKKFNITGFKPCSSGPCKGRGVVKKNRRCSKCLGNGVVMAKNGKLVDKTRTYKLEFDTSELRKAFMDKIGIL